ncbi:hypothetical protein GCM10027056_29830 [Glaciibacter psychrotolerans]
MPVSPPTPAPSTHEPVFASNAEALAAATAAYAQYQALSSLIGQEGGLDPDRMARVAVGQALDAEIESMRSLSKSGLRGHGQLAFDSLVIQSANLDDGSLVVYLCLDVSQTDVVDSDEVSVVPPDREVRYPLEVSFVSGAKRVLLVERSESWSGEDFC